MKTYKSHKTVEAAKVLEVEQPGWSMGVILTLQGDRTEVREVVAPEWVRKHTPGATLHSLVGGYFVRYADGYTSWSPAEAFEEGYSEVEAEAEGLPAASPAPAISPVKVEALRLALGLALGAGAETVAAAREFEAYLEGTAKA